MEYHGITNTFLRWLLHWTVVGQHGTVFIYSVYNTKGWVFGIYNPGHQGIVQVSLWNIAQIYIQPKSTLDSILLDISQKPACRCAVSDGWLDFNYEPSWDQSGCSLQSCSLNLVIFGERPAVILGSRFNGRCICYSWESGRSATLRSEMVRRQRIANRSLVTRHPSRSGHNTQTTHGHDMLGHGILSNQIW